MILNKYYTRNIEVEIKRLSKLFPVIVITGPRQSGKTTLCKNLFDDFHYVNLENISLREQILASPLYFINQYKQGLIIDEIQNSPELMSYIQVFVDENPESQIVLTGSNNFSLLQNVTQSLAGRAATVTLLPFSLKEIENIKGYSTNRLMLNGGFPAVWARNIPTTDMSRNYYNTYVERDIRQMINVKDLSTFQVFIRLCAGRVGSEFNASALSNEVGVSVPTIQNWLTILEASYILFRFPPFYKNIGKRLIKTPKIYFYDTGLLCYLLGITEELHLETHPLRGSIFENLVVLEFVKKAFNQGKEPNLYFYRDNGYHEVDLLEIEGGKMKAYEIKSARKFSKLFFRQLNYIQKLLSDDIISTMVIYDGNQDILAPKNGIFNFRNLDQIYS